MSEPSSIRQESWHRRIAANCNNAAWDLIEQPNLTPGQLHELFRLAATASYHWQIVGTATNIAHANLLYSWAAARSGAGSIAVDSARLALAHFSDNPSEDWERAFAHAAMAISLHCFGDQDSYRHHYLEAERIGATLAVENSELFQIVFRGVPQP